MLRLTLKSTARAHLCSVCFSEHRFLSYFFRKRKGFFIKDRLQTDMDLDLIFKIAAIGILVAVLYQVLVRAGREDQAMMTTLAGLVIVLTMVIKEISGLFDTVRTLFNL